MNIIDIRTILFSYVISNALCLAVVVSLWSRGRRRSPGLTFWLLDFAAQFLAVLLIALRGVLPDFVSILFGTPLILGGTLLLYAGLERYAGKAGSQRINIILIALFVLVHAYFTFFLPSLQARNVVFSAGLLVLCAQCAWLLLHRADAGRRPEARPAGVIFVIYCAVSLARLFADLAIPEGNDLFKSDLYDTLAILVYQMLFIGLTFSLFLMVNRRLFDELEGDIAALKLAQEQIDLLAKFPAENPNPILRIREDGILMYANQASRALLAEWGAAVDGPAPEFWRSLAAESLKQPEARTIETQCTGRVYSFFVVPVKETRYVNLYGHDVTEQKLAEETLLDSERRYRSLFENMLNGLAYCRMLFNDGRPEDFIFLGVNAAFERLTGLKDVVGRKVSEVIPGIHQSDPGLFEIYGRVALSGVPEVFETYLEAMKMWFSISVYSPQKDYFVAVFDVITARKEMEQALRDSETNFRALAENAGEGILVAVEGGIHVFANQAMAETSGYRVDELLALKAQNLSDPDEAAKIMKKLEQTLAGKPVSPQYETAIRTKDGRKIPVQISSSRTLWKGQPADIVFVQDITERKRVEEARQQSELLFRTLFELSPDAIMLIDPHDPRVRSRIVDCNAAACQMNGYRREELVDQSIELVNADPYTADGQIAYLEKIRQEGQLRYEVLHRRKNGTVFPVEVSTTIIEVGGRELLIGIDRDITERKQSEDALRASEGRYRDLVQNANSAIIRWKSDGTIAFFNEYAQMFFGYRADEVIGKDINILVPATESTGGDLTSLVKDILAHPEKFVNNVNENLCRDGRRVWMTWTNRPIFDANGQVIEILAVGSDITARKRVEEELNKAMDELKRSNAELEQFAYVASHDLQEPLRMVSSYMQLLERRYKKQLDQDADDFIGFAVDGAERMQRLINDLLAYSRLGTRGQPFLPASSEAALSQALTNLQVAIQESKGIITYDPLPRVVGDETQLVQLFQNLVGNALKFHRKEKPRVHVSAEGREREWVFSVRDNGIGIDPQYFERIFVIFQRLNSREKYAGTGIGLAMCKKIVQRHGGRIWVESQPGKGATFYFTLPRTGGEQA